MLPAAVRRGLHVLALMLPLLGLPLASPAQTTEQLLTERRLEYRAARAAYESALSAFRVVEQQFGMALREVDRARRSGDNDALERAFAQAQDRSLPFGAQEERVAATRATLEEARRDLIEIITVRLEQLLAQMDGASSSLQRAQLNALWVDLNNELESLEAESGGGLRLDPVVMPEVEFDPRDGPAELRFKAELLERRAAVADTAIQSVDHVIGVINDQIRIQRQRRDLEAALNRFEDTRLPVVSAQPPGDRPLAPDSTAAGVVPATPEERLRAWRGYREQLVSYRDQLLIRARTFRQSIRQVTQ